MASREPFSRHARRDGEPDGRGFERAAEFVAEAYGWTPAFVWTELSSEQLVLYLDAAQDRLEARQRAEFRGWVEAVRMGSIFAHDGRQYTRWASRERSRTERHGLTGVALERAIMGLARAHPEYVVVGA